MVNKSTIRSSSFFKKKNIIYRHLASGGRGRGAPPPPLFGAAKFFLNLHTKKRINIESPPPLLWIFVKKKLEINSEIKSKGTFSPPTPTD